MSWTHADTVDRRDEIADYMESFDPSEGEVVQGVEYSLIRAARRQSVDSAELAESVAEARAAGTTWPRIGEILGLDAAASPRLQDSGLTGSFFCAPSLRCSARAVATPHPGRQNIWPATGDRGAGGGGGESAFTQAGPGGDEAVVGVALGSPAVAVGRLVQQVGELACPVAVAAEGVQPIGGLTLGALQGSDEVPQRLPDRDIS